MGFSVESEIHIDVDSLVKKVNSDKLGLFAASEWKRLYTPYVPMKSGLLAQTGDFRNADSVSIRPWEIEHSVPYARRMYEGHFNFKRDEHLNASRMWDKAAEPTQKPKLEKAIQKYIDNGNLDLGKG